MAVLKINQFPDPVLAKKASPIARVEKTLYKLADDMLETMYHAPGIGLAANQVGLLRRILVIDVQYDCDSVPEGIAPPSGPGVQVINDRVIRNCDPLIVINPEIIYREGAIILDDACLSVPEYSAKVKRAEKIKLQYQDIDGRTQVLSCEDLLAFCVQHEVDHLDGKIFIDRLSPLKREMVKKRLRK